MYLLAETSDKKILFQSIEEMNNHLKINNLYPKIKSITEIDQGKYNQILRETAAKIKKGEG